MSNHRKEVKTYADCQKFAAEWLKEKELAGLSAWSLNLYGSALASSFGGISKHAFGYTYPSRERRNIVRNRNDNLSGYYCYIDNTESLKLFTFHEVVSPFYCCSRISQR